MFAPLAWGATNIASVEFINPSHFQDRRVFLRITLTLCGPGATISAA